MPPAPAETGSPPELTDRRVLVVEDDPTVREVAADYLRAARLLVDTASDGFEALQAIERTRPDLVVLDRLLPGIEGLEVCRRIRAVWPVPVLLLTALGTTEDRIAGLEAGADDYLAKPFSPRELVLRVQSILRRSLAALAPQSPFEVGGFAVDPSARTIAQDGRPLALSVREYDLLEFLLKHPRQVFDRPQLMREVWHWDIGDLSTVTVAVRRVREKVERDPAHPVVLRTIWGVGYRFDPPERT